MESPILFSEEYPIFTPISLTADGVLVLDQRLLPDEELWLGIPDVDAMTDAITTMIVRGAPTIGVAAAFGMVQCVRTFVPAQLTAPPDEPFWTVWQSALDQLNASRPTAVNLAWALAEMDTCAKTNAHRAWSEFVLAIETFAQNLHKNELLACLAIGKHGAHCIPEGATILTHCNAGALATAGYGTALGVIRAAYANDPSITVIASETRPRLQGAKLTAWELAGAGIPVTVASDNMIAHLMQQGQIDVVVTGADRIAANGDSANKIGTYSHALAAAAHNVPFYIAAPMSTVDLTLNTGAEIPIEERDNEEVWNIYGGKLPGNVNYVNPAFDVTPARLIEGIITQHGIARPKTEAHPFAQWSQTSIDANLTGASA